jgi:LmbE family N-acetylglucosaminyl deacetylase
MRVLAVSAHADDETLGCGGTLLKHRAAGDEIHWLLVTAPQKPMFDDAFIARRQAQIEAVSAAFGMTSVTVAGLPAAGLDALPLGEVLGPVRNGIAAAAPDRIYVVHRGDVHSDHRVAFDAVWAAVKPFNTAPTIDIYAYETMSSTNMAAPHAGAPFVATAYCDVGAHFDRKLEILRLFDTELQPPPHPRSLEAVEAAARYRGSAIGASHAEAFMVVRESW